MATGIDPPTGIVSADRLEGDFGGLQSFRIFDSCDVDDTRERISQIMQPHVLQPYGSSAAQHRGSMNYFQLGQMGIGTIRFGGMFVEVCELADYHLIVFCIKGRAVMKAGKAEHLITGTKGLCFGPGQPFRGKFSADCEQLIIKIDDRAMASHFGSPNTRLAPQIDLAGETMRGWGSLLQTLTESRSTLEFVQTKPAIAANYENLIIAMLAGAHTSDMSSQNFGAVPVSIRRAEAFMAANMADHLTLTDIGRATDIPVRTLLDNFRRFRADSPMRVLRNIRLDHAREQLLANACRTITQIAGDAGFTHLSRFSKDYRARFGECPSQTRAR